MNASPSILTSFLAFLLTVGTCGGKPHTKAGDNVPAQKLEVTKVSLRAIPADAVVVMTIASPYRFWDLLVKHSFIPLHDEQSAALDTEMKAHVKKHLGLDLERLQSIVVYGQVDGGAAIFSPVTGTLQDATVKDGIATATLHKDSDGDSKDMVAVLTGETLFVGTRKSVGDGLAALAGSSPAFQGEFHDYAHKQMQDSYFSISAQLDALPIPPNPYTEGLRRMAMRVSAGGMHASIEGKTATLQRLKSEYSSAVDIALSSAQLEMENAREDFFEGAVAIAGYYNALSLSKTLEPQLKGESMHLDFDLFGGAGSGMMTVSIVGILSAVAIPAFMKYIKKSKNAEATQFLRKMGDSATTNYMMTKQLPKNVGPTPAIGSCCAQGGDKCVPSSVWDHPTWKALDFAMRDPHYYSYEMKSATSSDGTQSFTAYAYGDLDCDGDYSTFSLYHEVIGGEIQSAGDVIMQDPLE